MSRVFGTGRWHRRDDPGIRRKLDSRHTGEAFGSTLPAHFRLWAQEVANYPPLSGKAARSMKVALASATLCRGVTTAMLAIRALLS